jgi:hypothetical protein
MTLFESVIEHRWPLLAAVTALYVVNSLVQYYRLRQFGGPWGTGFTKIRHNMTVFTGEAHNWYQEVSEKYGTSLEISHLPSHIHQPTLYSRLLRDASLFRTHCPSWPDVTHHVQP